MRKLIQAILIVLLSLAASVAFAASDTKEQALAILKSMTDYVSGQQGISLTFDSSIEVITPELEKIQFTNSGSAQLVRPAMLKASRTNGYNDVSLYFDGKTVSIHGKHTNSYAQFAAEGTIDQLLHAMREGEGIALPGADLLVTDSFATLSADILEAKYLGRGFVGQRECEHLAFRNFDTDWQLWVEAGDAPIPRKMVITSKTINGAPQYTLQVTGWESGIELGTDLFLFEIPAGAVQIGRDELVIFDELPAPQQ